MTIDAMKKLFREYGQRAGMQNVRAILDEEIVLLLDTSIKDIVNEELKTHAVTTNTPYITNGKVGTINSLRNLYKFYTLDDTERTDNPPMCTISEIVADTADDNNPLVSDKVYLIVGASAKYKERLFPVRIIDESDLANITTDFLSKPKYYSGVAYAVSDELYFNFGDYTMSEIKVSFIGIPTINHTDISGEVLDLPAYLHNDIVRHALDLYRVSITGAIFATQNNKNNQN